MGVRTCLLRRTGTARFKPRLAAVCPACASASKSGRASRSSRRRASRYPPPCTRAAASTPKSHRADSRAVTGMVRTAEAASGAVWPTTADGSSIWAPAGRLADGVRAGRAT